MTYHKIAATSSTVIVLVNDYTKKKYYKNVLIKSFNILRL